MRWWLGPVFVSECVANSRRWQTYAIRSFGVAALLAGMGTIAVERSAMVQGRSWRDYAILGESYFYAMIGVELALILLAAPAATAGAICLDRARGTLAHLLVTELSAPEIVLGKLAARLLPVLGLVACTWPVLALTSLLGGIDPTALTMAFVIIVAVALLGCTLALALSVWARKPHEVILATYTVWLLILLIWPVWMAFSVGKLLPPPPPWTLVANPFYLAFAPYAAPGRLDSWDYLGFFAVTLGASGMFTLLAIWRLRPASRRETGEGRRGSRPGLLGRLARRLPGPSLERNPVLWREWHRTRPSPWMVALLVLLGGTTGLACVLGALSTWRHGVNAGTANPGQLAGCFGYMIQMTFGLVMLSAVAAMSMSEERQPGSLDVVAATPLSTRAIVLGKWLGTFRLVPFLALCPGLMVLALATARNGAPAPVPPRGVPADFYKEVPLGPRLYGAGLVIATILAHGAMLTSIGLALAIWIKRPSRAIALSVGGFLLVAVAWPILASTVVPDAGDGRGVAALSPIMVAGFFADFLSIRWAHFGRGMLWWTTFWVLQVGSLAMGLAWLSTRTFDRCLGRVPERPRPTPLLADVVAILGGLGVVGCLFGAVMVWVKGAAPPGLSQEQFAGALGFVLLLGSGLVPLSVLAPLSMDRALERSDLDGSATSSLSARSLVAGRWWESFRLVVLLALGPGVIALALATARQVEFSPGATPPPWQSSLGYRLGTAALFVLTILAHGAATASVGVALAIAIRRRGRAIALSVGLFFLAAVAWPILVLILGDPRYRTGMAMMGLLMATDSLLVQLASRAPPLPGLLEWAASWAVLVSLLAAVVLGWAVRILQRRCPSGPRSETSIPMSRPPRRPRGEGDRLTSTIRT
jgi:ABC-type transport system involved in multi-copper enzyme maturation permease subunit